MTVRVFLKRPVLNGKQVFEFREDAVFDDKEAGRLILSYGKLSGGRIGEPKYKYTEADHIAYDWNDVERVEILNVK